MFVLKVPIRRGFNIVRVLHDHLDPVLDGAVQVVLSIHEHTTRSADFCLSFNRNVPDVLWMMIVLVGGRPWGNGKQGVENISLSKIAGLISIELADGAIVVPLLLMIDQPGALSLSFGLLSILKTGPPLFLAGRILVIRGG